MNIKEIYIRLLTVFALIALTHIAIAATTSGADDRNKNKYSLKNLNKLSKNYSLSALHLNHLNTTGFTPLNPFAGAEGTQNNSFVSVQRGNTTYVFPYKYKIKVPRFKTPAPPQQ